ncbi:MAG: potassium channel family protein, partial [Lentisphaeria bacterium]
GTVISSLYTLKKSRLKRTLGIILTLLIPLCDLIGLTLNMSWLLVVGRCLLMVLYLILISTIVEDIVESEIINRDTICGAVCGFMLIATFFGTIYTLLFSINPNHFNLANNLATGDVWFELLYFSYITITSVGYGDITPASSVARSIIIIQSICGTFYLATLVAHIVSGLDRAHKIEKLEQKHKDQCDE